MKTVLLSSLSYEGRYGGVENSLRFMSNEMVRQGMNVIILAASPSGKIFKRVINKDKLTLVSFRREFSRNRLINLFCFPLVVFDLMFSLYMIKKNYTVDRSITRNQFICFFVNLFFSKVNFYLAPGFSHRQSSSENMSSHSRMLTFRRYIHMNFDYAALRFSCGVFVFSKNMLIQAQEVASKFSSKWSLSEIKIVKPGVDKEIFYPVDQDTKNTVKDKLKIPKDKIVLLCVGRFVKAKGFDLAIRSLCQQDAYYLVIVGDGPEYESLNDLAIKLGVIDRVSFFGARHDVNNFYQASDYFFMSSVYEPLGQTILEAISCGLPVLAFEHGVITATKEITEGEGLFLIDSTSPDDMASLFSALPGPQSKLYAEKSNQSYLRSLKFEWRNLVDDLLS
ncbi:glycosyltransferase family 4 protein [Shewanella subflava]|uniref:Glycosyltransferase family 4 protein n=1 Tax=Shewanella subflava TaxID=2986476 RepID=A0ABT3IBS6_9GAMM|nr:glycosyltransferase family 4 protein [Shewanella subflava]MCW3173488.1 glycosyltransferase family 4 protein [Shewanella subflava]